jgi:hypothetical protein
MLPAVVTAIGEVSGAANQNRSIDLTGPENVVNAMIFPYIQVKCISLYVVSRDCLMHRISPEWSQYTPKEKGAQAPFSQTH